MAQHQQHAATLACKLVKELHGDVVEKVARHIVSKGLQTLPEVVRGTELPPSQVRQALLVLLQQNYVSSYMHREEEGIKNARPPYHLYEPCLSRMLQIIRYPRFLLHIKDEMGEEAERIIEILLQMGRLSLEQVVRAVAGRLEQDPAELQERVRNIFMSLVQSHYVERVPPCTLPPPKVAPHPDSVKGRKSAASKAGSASLALDQSRALRTLEETAFEKQRFKLPPELLIDMAMQGVTRGKGSGGGAGEGAEAGTSGAASGSGTKREAEELGTGPGPAQAPPAKKQRVKAGSAAATAGGKGVKAGEVGPSSAAAQRAMEEAAAAAVQPSLLLWRVNTEEFNRRFRHRTCVSMVSEKIDSDAGHVLSAMLTASRPFEAQLKEDRSTTLGVEEIMGTANRLIETSVLPKLSATLPTIISTIAHDNLELISLMGHGPGGEQYVVNMGRIIELVQLKQVEAVIRDKFGTSGLRIFRLLLMRGQLEQKQVTDFSMLSPKDTRELLYRMLKGGFLALQDIPRTSDRAPSRTLYTWRANIEAARSQVAGELYAAAGRVWSRLRHEMDKEKELLDLLEEARAKGELNFTLTDAQKSSITRLKRAVDTLETSLLQLDEMIAVFNEY